MEIAPLAIIQVRMGSTRLHGKALLPLAGKPIIQHVYERAVGAFGAANVVAAIPDASDNALLAAELARLGCPVVIGSEVDVLARFWKAAHTYRWRPESVIVRVTADDPFKDPAMMQRVAAGERLPVELGGEAFTLAMLDEAYFRNDAEREHLTNVLFPVPPPPAPTDQGVLTIDTEDDYLEACYKAEGRAPSKSVRRRKVPA